MENLYNLIMNIINDMSVFGILVNGLLIIVESIIPPLPLGLFVTILFINYGKLLGFIISWILTVIGCTISFYVFKILLKNQIDNYLRKYKYVDKYIMMIDKIKFSNLVLILSIPFTPAFLVNISAGISNMSFKKFLSAIMIGKISLVLFWGLIGTGLIESLKNPITILSVIGLVLIAYIISKIVNEKINFN